MVKSRIRDVALLIKSTFEVSIPLHTVLKYKLAVCKDYAKLTAVLLYNLFPDNSIYFISIPRHVAAGIKINGKLYVLDQKLPVMTLNGWLRVWNRKTASIYRLKISESNGKRKLELEKFGIAKLTNPSAHLNNEKLTNEVARLMGINQIAHGSSTIVKITFPSKLAKSYEDDEIIIYSMAKTIKLKLENELCTNVDRIARVEVIQDGDDLLVKVSILPR